MLVLCLLSLSLFIHSDGGWKNDLNFSKTIPSPSMANKREPDTWTIFSHDLRHTGNTTSGAPLDDSVLWSNLTGGPGEIYSSPIVGEGKVFVGTRSSYLYCFDEDTGERLWSRYFNKVTWGMCGSVTVVNGNVYIGAEDNNMYCLDPETGGTIWSYTTGGAIWSCAAVLAGKVYVGSADRYVYCLDEGTGDLIWKFETAHSTYGYQDYGVSSSPAIANGKLFIGACDGKCYCLPLEDPNGDGLINNSEIHWKFDTGCYIYASPTVMNGKVYIGTGSYSKMAGAPEIYKIFCIDENNGNKIWDYRTESHIMGTPSIGYEKLYIGSMDGKLYCLPLLDPNSDGNISEGEVIWKFDTGNEIWGSAAIAAGQVYFGSGIPYWANGNGDYRVYCLPLDDPNGNGIISSSEVTWSKKIAGGILTSVAIVNERMYVSAYDGMVYCFAKDEISPRVDSTTPSDGETDVLLDADISVMFNEDINSSTLTGPTFAVVDENSVAVQGTFLYDGNGYRATFDPTSNLEENISYTATLTSGIEDPGGNGLDCDGDGVYEPNDEYSWSFTTITYPPVMSAIPTQRPVEGVDWHLDMADHVTDPTTPDEELKVTENSSYATVNGTMITFNYPNGITTEHVNVTVADGISTIWQDVLVKVKLSNDPPVVSEIPLVIAVEDEDRVVDVSPFITDLDNEPDELILSVNTTFASIAGMVITFNYPDGILSDVVNITVDDGHKCGYGHMRINVTPVNDPPTISSIPELTATEDMDLELNMTKYISDMDNPLSELNASTDSNHTRSERGCGGILKIVFNYPDGIVSETVNITVFDLESSSFQFVSVTVIPVNDAPVLKRIPELTAVEDENFVLDLSMYVEDVDTPLIRLKVRHNASFLVGSDGLLLTFNYPNGILKDVVNISVSEGGLTSYRDVIFLITPVNDPPVLTGGKVSPRSGDAEAKFTFSVQYLDIDSDDSPTVEVVIDGKAHEMARSEGLEKLEYVFSTRLGKGAHDYHFACNDNSGGPHSTCTTESESLTVTEASGGLSGAVSAFVIIIIVIVVFFVGAILMFIFLKKRKEVEEAEVDVGTDMANTKDENGEGEEEDISRERDEKVHKPV